MNTKKGEDHSTYKHGESLNYKRSRLYRIYDDMISRTTREGDMSYQYYGARGIVVCDEWVKNKIKFFQWAYLNGYKNELQIDRINNDENYCPENCQWVTPTENQRKRDRRPDWGLSKRGNSYQVKVVRDGIVYRLGSSIDKRIALKLRDDLLLKLK